MKKVTINCSEKEAFLIEQALDLYSRISMGQFGEIGKVTSIQRKLWADTAIEDEFDVKCDELKQVFGLSKGSYWGIFNKENVHDDAREAFHIQQVMRHERYLHRMRTGEQKENRGAKEQNKGVAIEDLAGIRFTSKRRNKKFRTKLGKWSFSQLRQFLAYKCQLNGVNFKVVNPRYTSQTCCKCKHIGERTNKVFKCTNTNCKVDTIDADFNASKNISLLGASVNKPESSTMYCSLHI